MRILWVSNAPHCNSGYGVVTAQVCKRLKAQHDIAIFAFHGLQGGMLEWEGIPVYPNDSGDYSNLYVEQFAKEWKADIVITLLDVWVLDQKVYSKFKWIPYFPIDHAPIPPLVIEHLKARYDAITMSRFGELEAKKAGIANTYIPHGVDTKVFKPDAALRDLIREYLGIQDKFVVGTVAANKGERKNFKAMLQAFARFHKEHPDTAFVVYTNPHEKHGVQNMPAYCKELGIADAVIFPTDKELIKGATAQEMAALYNSMDVFLLLSKGEGFGIPVIEAQACGVPVVVTDFSAMSELCGAGWKVKVKELEWTYQSSYQALASVSDAVEKLEAAYENAHSLRDKARQFALGYDWDKVVEDYWLPYLAKDNYRSYYENKADVAHREIAHLSPAIKEAWEWYHTNRNDVSLGLLPDRTFRNTLVMGCEGVIEDAFMRKVKAEHKVGIDLAPTRIDWGEFRQGYAEDTGLPDGSCDLVICRELIEHVKDDDRLLVEVGRVLEPGGYLLIGTPNGLNVPPDGKEHIRAYTPESFLAKLSSHGLTPVKQKGTIPNVFSVLMKQPSLLAEYKRKAEIFDRLEDNYAFGTHLMVLCRKQLITKITLTNRCNARCKSCLTPQLKEHGSMPPKELHRVLADTVAGYVSFNNIGEVFTNPELVSALASELPELRKRGIRTGITTNGLLSTPLPVDDYVVSFNGWGKQSYEDMTGLPFEDVVANIRKLAKVQQGLQIHYLSVDGEAEHEMMFVNLFKDLKVPLRISRKVENQFGLLDRPQEKRIPCDYLDMKCINWNGDTILCAHDFRGEVVLTDELRARLKQEHKQGIFTGLCEKCNYNTKTEGKIFYAKT